MITVNTTKIKTFDIQTVKRSTGQQRCSKPAHFDKTKPPNLQIAKDAVVRLRDSEAFCEP